jgi:ribosome-binding protein aMBF1 (putative translation factor)
MTIKEIYEELSIIIEKYDTCIMKEREIPGMSKEKIEGKIEGLNYARMLLEKTEEINP